MPQSDNTEDLPATDAHRHARHSVLRERIVEHVFVGDVLRRLWQRGITDVELLRAEFDAGGYDLVLTRGTIIRHLQLKAMIDGGKSSRVVVNLQLALKPSGCVLWIVVDHALNFQAFRWFGGPPGQPLPDMLGNPTARHTRANARGIKPARPGHRLLHRRDFAELDNLDAVLERLFGSLPARQQVNARDSHALTAE
ncbi:hypothetical protein [Ralstonia pseudosolanacearum]|uniref:hypothetical protein n=1 Tax=Ralstonia pseudosolanacearum TaxID=1310165 RepID=UPI003AAE7C66